MCNSPLKIERRNEMDTIAKCRKCTECIKDRKRRWVGRALAEQQTAKAVWFATFTYGGGYENERAYALRYSDLQKTFKKIRKAGYKFKYIAVGEYGGERERAHFHAMIFWQSEPPKRPMGEHCNKPKETRPTHLCSFWEHGIVQYELPRSTNAAAVYVMDYLAKNDNAYDTRLRYSKAPALGNEYLMRYARERAANGVSMFPDGPSFTVPGSIARNGKPFWYRLDRDSATYRDMMLTWLEEWALGRPNTPLALSKESRAWLWDAVQDVGWLPETVREYLARMYDITEVGDIPDPQFVSVAQNVQYRADARRIEVYNGEKRIWSNHFADAVAPPEGPKNLTQEAVNRLLQFTAKSAPLFVVQHVLSGKLPSREREALQRGLDQRASDIQELLRLSQSGRLPPSHQMRPSKNLETSESQTCSRLSQRRPRSQDRTNYQEVALSPIAAKQQRRGGLDVD